MGGTAGKVALVSNQTNLTCGADCDAASGVVDFVGYGAANDFAGAGPTSALSNTTSAQRKLIPLHQHGQQRRRLHRGGAYSEGPTRHRDAADRLRR